MSSNLIVISGPSGSGKTTLIRMLLKEHPDIIFSVSHTTRGPRDKEHDGREYYFINEEKFLRMVDEDAFVEWARVHDQYYGTSFQEIESKASGSKFMVLDIDVQGAKIIRRKFPDALFILVSPPSIKELEIRLLQRGHDIDEEFQQRLRIAREELKEYPIYDFIIINDKLRKAYGVLNSIYTAAKNTAARNEARINRIIDSAKEII
jgi:guanylate kinase